MRGILVRCSRSLALSSQKICSRVFAFISISCEVILLNRAWNLRPSAPKTEPSNMWISIWNVYPRLKFNDHAEMSRFNNSILVQHVPASKLSEQKMSIYPHASHITRTRVDTEPELFFNRLLIQALELFVSTSGHMCFSDDFIENFHQHLKRNHNS